MSTQDVKHEEITKEVRPWLHRLGLPVVLVELKTLEIIYANYQFEELMGVAEENLVQQSWSVLFDGKAKETLNSISDLYNLEFEVFTPVEHDLSIVRKSGRSVPVICSFSGIVVAGHELLMVTFFDHTKGVKEKQKLAEDLKSVYHMAKLADLGKIAASVAHEMNNPLMVIQGQAELLELKASKNALSEEEVRRLVDPIYRSVERMSQIVTQMKNIARAPDGKMDKMDLARVMNEGLLLVQHRSNFLGVEIKVECPAGVMVKGNRTQIEQVVVNMINNAMDAMEEASYEVRKITITVTPSSDYTLVEIWNTGPAIPKEVQDSILNPFFTTKAVGKGTGLGLSVCSGILRAHKGSLKLKYSNDKGTCFEMKFPAIKDDGSKDKVKALVVDDEQLVRRVIKERLEEEGFQVITAKNGQEGLEKVISHPDVAIVFTDLKMPVMDGMEFIRQVRGAFPELLVVVISGFLDSLDTSEASVSVDEKLDKPFTSRQFREVLSSVQKKMDGRRKILAA
ncbi:MAG: response regulator [Bdellovibrionaceae bacterium]|nr:response regulator [Bdellovibrionales bacterium]MCB9084960.1 response regulator [Pseudobdellovibrionaceae bacterium]